MSRLNRLAHELRPGVADRWNGELYARTDDKWGGLHPNGSLRLSRDLVLRHLSGSADGQNPRAQAQALATVLHESYHARSGMDAPDEPNAVRRRETIGLDEGLTERQAVADFDQFADRSGYGGLKLESFEYEGAVHATNDLLAYAAPEAEQARDRLALAEMDKPAVMSWDVIADEIVRNRVDGVVPGDPRHQQAARAELVTAMSGPGWDGVQHRREAGPLVAADTKQALDAAMARIRQHYETTPGAPYPARYPNRQAAAAAQLLGGEQARTVQDPTRWPAPDPSTRMTAGADGPAPQPAVRSERRSPEIADPALRAAFSGQAPAAQAVQTAPSLGDGARGSSSGARAHDRGVPTGRDER